MPPVDPHRLAAHWAWALDAASRAVDAGGVALPTAVLATERRHLMDERPRTAALLQHLRNGTAPWLPPGPVTPRLLGLPERTTAVYLDLEGILTDGGAFHAAAWAEALDPVLLHHSRDGDRPYVPFERADYVAYFDGRSRYVGLELFLAGRGIHLSRREIHQLAERKGVILESHLHRRHAAALPGAARYLEAAGCARVRRIAVSASTNAPRMLELAGLASLVDGRVVPERVAAAPPEVSAVVTCLDQVAHAALDAGLVVLEGPLARLLDPRVGAT